MQQRTGLCDYFGFLFLTYCAAPNLNLNNSLSHETRIQKRAPEIFSIDYEWSYINFTWSSKADYEHAVFSTRYIPENIVPAGIKFYKDKVFVALPRIRSGTPVTLASTTIKGKLKKNLLLSPYPSWKMNVKENCSTLQSVQSMEIDRRGIMWVIDGMRINTLTSCPPKLILFDLNNNGRVMHTFIFGSDISLREGGFLNDIVIDESDGGYAFITDNSDIDPGLIVYSRRQGRAWKLRDKSMFGETEATNFTVDGLKVNTLKPVDGIALSPLPKNRDDERLVYYTALNGFTLYAISTKILKNEKFCKSDAWRFYVKRVGKKKGISGGLIIDNQGNMYYGLIDSYGIGKWNIYEDFSTAGSIQESNDIIWPDSFGMDSAGSLYLLINGIHKYFDPKFELSFDDKTKFRIMKLYTGNKNYMFSGK